LPDLFRKIKTIILAILFISVIFSSQTLTGEQNEMGETKELYLLRVDHYLELEAIKAVDSFSIKYAFPPDYGFQVPILIEILNGTTADIHAYTIEPDSLKPNRIVNFSIGSMQKDEHCMIHFTIWVIVEDFYFSDVPGDVALPQTEYENPVDIREWLSRSEVVQSNRLRIKYYANRLKGANDNILSYAQNVSSFIKNHRYGLFLIQLWTRSFLKQDAITTLLINGENVGRSHLACALFRSQDIPARVILVHNDQGFWTQMHYMVEYYILGYGWVLLDPTWGETPFPTHRQVINRICSIEDEDDTKHDYIYRFMKGEERWIWIDSEHINPYYLNCEEGSKSQMFTESRISAKSFAVDYTIFRTQNVFNQYEKYLGNSLSSDNQQHLESAITFQKQACTTLVETNNINDYVFFIEKAYDEYKSID